MRRGLGRIAVGVAVVLGLTVAAPVGAVKDPELPVSWLWSWITQRPAWALPAVELPREKQVPEDPATPADTRADGGAGRAPKAAAGTLAGYQPYPAGKSEQGVTPPGRQGFNEQTSKRSAAKSTRRTDVFENADGSETTRTYPRAVNYRDESGAWQPIDSRLTKRSDGRLHNAANSSDASLATTLTAAASSTPATLATLKLATGESVGYSLDGAAAVTAQVDGAVATYPSVLPDTDLELATYAGGIKETLVLRSPQAASSWSFPLTLDGLTPRFTEGDDIELLNAAGTAVAWLPHGSMKDSNVDPVSGAPAESTGVTYKIVQEGGGTVLKVDVDRAWLTDPARKYPVFVDPTATTDTSGDVMIDNDTSTPGNGDNLPVGTYNGGTTTARSFLRFDNYTADNLIGKRVTAAKLQLYLTWAASCQAVRAFDVRAVTENWTVAGLAGKVKVADGPSFSDPIGSLTVSDPAVACANTGADRSVGQWVGVGVAAAGIDRWARGNANYGLALTASETDTNAWKRFTSADYRSGAYAAHLDVTWVSDVPPQTDVRYPANNAVVPSLTPEFLAKGHDPDKWPNKGLTYTFTVLSADGKTEIVRSPDVASSWTVPAGKLAWNTSYLYYITTHDTYAYSYTSKFAFTTSVPQPAVTSNLAQNGGKGFDASIGNYTTSATDANVSTVGPSLSITRSYNSLDIRHNTAFGVGWSSILDAKATPVSANGSVQSVRVTYPTGAEVAFGRTATGTYVAPSGRFSTFSETTSGTTVTAYTLTDKDATVYTFGQATAAGDGFRLTAITDANGRKLTIAYGSDGNASTLTSASGRTLAVVWSTPAGATAPHVASVTTDRANAADATSANTWTYGYESNDQLSKVCQPDDATYCWQYSYDTTSQHRNTVLNDNPVGYWPMAEAAGTSASSAVLSNAGVDVARYSNVALGQRARDDGGTATTAGFDGTSSFVQLPSNLIADGQYQSISMWFRTTTRNGVLFSYNADPLSKGTSSGDYTPALYVDTNGKLRGELWTGVAKPMTSDVVVDDGAWHHVVLAGAGASQTLYLDGEKTGTPLAGTISRLNPSAAQQVNVGGGFIGDAWPDHANTGLATGKAAYFAGQIADVAFFNQTLDATQSAALFNTGTAGHPSLSTVVRPSGGVTAQIGFDKVTGKVSSVVDENGGTWKLSAPAVAGSSLVYAGKVLGAQPREYYRLGDVPVDTDGDGTTDFTPTSPANEVAGGEATYSNVTLGAAGPFADATAAKFNGTSSYVELPTEDVPSTGPISVEMWFQMPDKSTAGGVLFGYQIPAAGEAATNGWTPALYVDTKGFLRGGFWTGTGTQVVSPVKVNDGTWHHVALSATTNTQALRLDQNLIGAISGATLTGFGAQHAYVGTGRWDGIWADHGSNPVGWFPGTISDFSIYGSTLSGDQVTDHFASVKQTVPVAFTMLTGTAAPTAIPMPVSQVTVTTPDNVHTQVSSYDLINGNRLVAQTDEDGHTTKYGYDVGGYSSMVYDPMGALTQTLQDARGNTKQTITCQNQSAKLCSSVYYSYFPDATTTTLTPNPKNDLLLTQRDGRSSSETDNRYLTSNGYDDHGNLTTVTEPLNRITRTSYTDASSVAADGGTPPAGLPTLVTTPGGATQSVTYFKSGDVAQVVEPNGKIHKYTYDGLGQVLTETEATAAAPAGVVTSHTYDRMGRELTQKDPPTTNRVTGAVHTQLTTTEYDSDGNAEVVKQEDTTGGDATREESHTYNKYGQEETSTTPGGAVTRFGYDSYGRILTQTNNDGVVTANSYDGTGNLTDVVIKNWTGDPNDPSDPQDLLVAHNEYDQAGRLAREVDAKGTVTEHTYTDNGLEATVTRKFGTDSYVVADNKYDAAGNLVSETTNNGRTTVTHHYDDAGREDLTTADPNGLKRTTEMTRDLDDHVLTSVRKDASGTVVEKMEALYDAAGRSLAQVAYKSTDLAPVGRWKLDDAAGTRAADGAGNSPAGSDKAVWSASAPAGHTGSLSFADGTTPLSTGGPVLDTTRSYTVSVWVYLTTTAGNRAAVSQDGGAYSSFLLGYDGSKNAWRMLLKQNPSTDALAYSKAAAAQNTWTHLSAVYDTAAKTVALYVNGELQNSTAVASSTASNGGPLRIGEGTWTGVRSDGWSGQIADVQAYQSALTADQIKGIAAGTFAAAASGVIRSSYQYDEDDHAVAVTDPNGNTTYTSYDEDGNAVKTAAPAALADTANGGSVMANAVSWTGYNTFGEATDTKDALGNWSSTWYDADGRPTVQRMPAYTPPGSATAIVPETTTTYTSSGQVDKVTDADKNVTDYDYDQLDRLSKVTAASGAVTRFGYDRVGNRTSTTSPTGAVTLADFDYMGRQTTATDVVRQDGASYQTLYTYTQNSSEWTSAEKSPRGVTSTTKYSALGEPVEVADALGNTTKTAYDGAGRAVKVTLPDGTYSTTSYDLAGRATGAASYDETGKQLRTTSTEYDRAGNVTATIDGRKTRTAFDYDATGMLVRERQPINGSDLIDTTFGYDLEGNRTRFTDGRGNAFWTTYNSWGLPESQIEPATTAHPNAADRTFTTVYNKTGQAAQLIQPGGVTITNKYDAIGQLKTQDGAGAEATTASRAFDYDDDGRLTRFSGVTGTNIVTYDDRNLPRSVTGPSGDSAFTYNEDGDLASRTDAAGTTVFHYDTDGRVDRLDNTAKGITQAYGYDPLSTIKKITYGSGGTYRSFTYDKLHRLTGDELLTAGNASIAKLTYGWNDNDDMTSKTTTNFGGKTVSNTYDYDLADRLTSWNDGTNTTVYAYDKAGNRTQAGAKVFTYDERNRLLTGDGVGYSYTSRGTLSAAGTEATKADAFGQVISQTYGQSTGTKTYKYDSLGRNVQDGFSYTGAGNDLAGDGTSTYVRDTGNEVAAEGNASGTRYTWTDLHDDIVAQFGATSTALDASTIYDPLGKVVASAGALIGNLGYQSEWTDTNTGRVNMAARWYNTATGQFDTRDTASNSPAPDSVNANRYQYGDANPLTVTDPTGHWGWPNFVKHAVSAVSSAISRGMSSMSSYAYSAYSYAYSRASSAYHAAKSYVKRTAKRAYHAVRHAVHKLSSAAKRHMRNAVAKIKKHTPKFVKAAVHRLAQKSKAALRLAKQAGKAVVSGAARVATHPLSAIKDAAKATAKFVAAHKDALLEVAAIAGSVLAGMACTAVTAGLGAVACMVGAGALINLSKDALQGDIHSVGDALGSMGTGALTGLAGGAGGVVAAKVGTLVAAKAGTGLVGRLATEALENGVDDVLNQAVTTGRVDPRTALLGSVPGLGAALRKGKGLSRGFEEARGVNFVSAAAGAGCGGRRHSFHPDTKVLMADGRQRPIKDVNVGDQVLATDPLTGKSKAEPVTQLHRNTDHDLTMLTVEDQNGRRTVLNTTQHHPFWDEKNHNWSDAKDLKPGDQLKVASKGKVKVVAVVNYDGAREMRDLTVGSIHTYYVLAGNTPVLVHNTGPCTPDLTALSESGQRAAKGGRTAAGRAYQKHMDRGELDTVPGAQLDEAGQNLLDDILTNPATTSSPVTSGGFQGGTRYVMPGPTGQRGFGATFDQNGVFQYFGRY